MFLKRYKTFNPTRPLVSLLIFLYYIIYKNIYIYILYSIFKCSLFCVPNLTKLHSHATWIPPLCLNLTNIQRSRNFHSFKLSILTKISGIHDIQSSYPPKWLPKVDRFVSMDRVATRVVVKIKKNKFSTIVNYYYFFNFRDMMIN